MAVIQAQQQLEQVYYSTVISINPNLVPNIPGTDSYFKAKGVSQVAANVVQDVQQFANNIFPPSASGAFLDKHASNLGIQPRFGAKPSVGTVRLAAATGGNTALANYTIPAGTVLSSSLTGQQYQTSSDTAIIINTAINAITVDIQSVIIAAGTGSPADDVLTFAEPITVATGQTITQATVTAVGMTSGSDIETDNQLAFRIFSFSQFPRGGGSIGDYLRWCELGSVNVTQATLIKSPFGNANILYPVVVGGSPNPNVYVDGTAANGFIPAPYPINRSLTNGDVASVQAYINGVRPVNNNPVVLTVATYGLQDIDPIYGNGSYFDVNVSLSPGLALTTVIVDSNNVSLTVSELIKREFRRAVIATPLGGSPVNDGTALVPNINQYIVVSNIERLMMINLGNADNFQGALASVLVSVQIEYHAEGAVEATYFVPVPSLKEGNLFTEIDDTLYALMIYDIDTSIINITVV